MLPAPSSIVVLVLLQSPPDVEPPNTVTCANVERIEVSSEIVATREICVGPGLVTSFLFDTPARVDLQDEVRFKEVTQGRSSISFVPPPDMAPGERLRLTARFGNGPLEETITFTLVAHSGQATHQVEVYRNERSRESFLLEMAQERARIQQLQTEVEQLRARLNRAGRLRALIGSGALGVKAIQSQEFHGKPRGYSQGDLTVTRGISYRCDTSVAMEFWLKNSGTEPWSIAGASLSANGQLMKGVVWEAAAIPPQAMARVVVEADATRRELNDEAVLSLWDAGTRIINIPAVTFP